MVGRYVRNMYMAATLNNFYYFNKQFVVYLINLLYTSFIRWVARQCPKTVSVPKDAIPP